MPIPVLKRVTIASISRTIRGIPTEVLLDEDDGMPVRCVVSLDNLGDVWKAMLTEQVTTLRPDRMRQVCQALSIAVGCGPEPPGSVPGYRQGRQRMAKGGRRLTALPHWMDLPNGLGAEDYEALPEEICRRIEIVDGAVIVNAAPSRRHQDVCRRLTNVLEAACGPALAVSMDVDLRLRDVPLLNRRPDAVVYDASLPDEAVLRPEHCVLVVEIMSPGSVTTDQTDKPAEYAAAGITHYWRVERAAPGSGLSVFCYRLDPTTRTYASAGVYSGKMTVTDPVNITLDLTTLL